MSAPSLADAGARARAASCGRALAARRARDTSTARARVADGAAALRVVDTIHERGEGSIRRAALLTLAEDVPLVRKLEALEAERVATTGVALRAAHLDRAGRADAARIVEPAGGTTAARLAAPCLTGAPCPLPCRTPGRRATAAGAGRAGAATVPTAAVRAASQRNEGNQGERKSMRSHAPGVSNFRSSPPSATIARKRWRRGGDD